MLGCQCPPCGGNRLIFWFDTMRTFCHAAIYSVPYLGVPWSRVVLPVVSPSLSRRPCLRVDHAILPLCKLLVSCTFVTPYLPLSLMPPPRHSRLSLNTRVVVYDSQYNVCSLACNACIYHSCNICVIDNASRGLSGGLSRGVRAWRL